MTLAQAVLPEFDNEMAATRKVLEVVPEADAAWAPHEKSLTLGDLAAHIANLPRWAEITLKQPDFDANPVDGPSPQTRAFTTTAELIRTFDESVALAREILNTIGDDEYTAGWSLKNKGAVMFTMPRPAVLRSFVLNHIVHHRGQLTVYLRLRGVPLPNVYGPTADAPMF